MKIIYNSFIPFKGFTAINICGTIYARKECEPLSDECIRHEQVHTNQMKEDGCFKFYVKYAYEYIRNLFAYQNFKLAYYMISYEIEAYSKQNNKTIIINNYGKN